MKRYVYTYPESKQGRSNEVFVRKEARRTASFAVIIYLYVSISCLPSTDLFRHARFNLFTVPFPSRLKDHLKLLQLSLLTCTVADALYICRLLKHGSFFTNKQQNEGKAGADRIVLIELRGRGRRFVDLNTSSLVHPHPHLFPYTFPTHLSSPLYRIVSPFCMFLTLPLNVEQYYMVGWLNSTPPSIVPPPNDGPNQIMSLTICLPLLRFHL